VNSLGTCILPELFGPAVAALFLHCIIRRKKFYCGNSAGQKTLKLLVTWGREDSVGAG